MMASAIESSSPVPCCSVPAKCAVERVGYAAAFGGGDAGAVVFHPDGEGGRGLAETYIDAPPCRGVADGVVGEGFDEGVDFGVVGTT